MILRKQDVRAPCAAPPAVSHPKSSDPTGTKMLNEGVPNK